MTSKRCARSPSYLDQIPGRKNVLWLSGGSSLYLTGRARTHRPHDGEWRAIYDELETQRIAIYPIDVRGLMLVTYSLSASHLPVMDQTSTPEQHGLMSEIAQATGGRAVYNNNGIAQADDQSLWTTTGSITPLPTARTISRMTIDGTRSVSLCAVRAIR